MQSAAQPSPRSDGAAGFDAAAWLAGYRADVVPALGSLKGGQARKAVQPDSDALVARAVSTVEGRATRDVRAARTEDAGDVSATLVQAHVEGYRGALSMLVRTTDRAARRGMLDQSLLELPTPWQEQICAVLWEQLVELWTEVPLAARNAPSVILRRTLDDVRDFAARFPDLNRTEVNYYIYNNPVDPEGAARTAIEAAATLLREHPELDLTPREAAHYAMRHPADPYRTARADTEGAQKMLREHPDLGITLAEAREYHRKNRSDPLAAARQDVAAAKALSQEHSGRGLTPGRARRYAQHNRTDPLAAADGDAQVAASLLQDHPELGLSPAEADYYAQFKRTDPLAAALSDIDVAEAMRRDHPERRLTPGEARQYVRGHPADPWGAVCRDDAAAEALLRDSPELGLTPKRALHHARRNPADPLGAARRDLGLADEPSREIAGIDPTPADGAAHRRRASAGEPGRARGRRVARVPYASGSGLPAGGVGATGRTGATDTQPGPLPAAHGRSRSPAPERRP